MVADRTGVLSIALMRIRSSTSALSDDDPTKLSASMAEAMARSIGVDGDDADETTSSDDATDTAMRTLGSETVDPASMPEYSSTTYVECSDADDASVSAWRSHPRSRFTEDRAVLAANCTSRSDDRRTSFFIVAVGTEVETVRLLAIDRNEVRMICAVDADESTVRSDAIVRETDGRALDSDETTSRFVAKVTPIAITAEESALVASREDDSDRETEARGMLDADVWSSDDDSPREIDAVEDATSESASIVDPNRRSIAALEDGSDDTTSSVPPSSTDFSAVIVAVGTVESASRSDDSVLGTDGFGDDADETTSSDRDRSRATFGSGDDADETTDRSVDRNAVRMSADERTVVASSDDPRRASADRVAPIGYPESGAPNIS